MWCWTRSRSSRVSDSVSSICSGVNAKLYAAPSAKRPERDCSYSREAASLSLGFLRMSSRVGMSSRVSHDKPQLRWSCRFSPTPGSSYNRGTFAASSTALLPMPDRSKMAGDSNTPAQRMTSLAYTETRRSSPSWTVQYSIPLASNFPSALKAWSKMILSTFTPVLNSKFPLLLRAGSKNAFPA